VRYCPRVDAAIFSTAPQPKSTPLRLRGSKMELLIGFAIFAAIWIVVIWGSSYVNKNVQ
jgi:hypothetical protein